MSVPSFGATITALRKGCGMTQLDLAREMGVTDKAVSKWERDLSFPDVASLPRLAEVLDVSVDDLLKVKTAAQERPKQDKFRQLLNLVFKAVALAMGVCVAVLSVMGKVESRDALVMLGVGLACLALAQLSSRGAEGE
jgi:DNA-binding XRE family transcriptional regulator